MSIFTDQSIPQPLGQPVPAEHASDEPAARPRAANGDIFAIAFGVTASMWIIGYFSRIPPAVVPNWLLFFLLIGAVAGGGWILGRWTRRGAGAALATGVISATLNMMILGSLMLKTADGRVDGGALVSMPLFAAISALISAAGWWGARRSGPPREGCDGVNWTRNFAIVAACATATLLVLGGLVTSREAGLAIADWPTSAGVNMFLFPLSQMTGNKYFEHTHRLYGALVGFTTIALGLYLMITRPRARVSHLALIAILAVIGQGVMGGLRVVNADTGAVAVSPGTAVGADGVEIAQPQHETGSSRPLRVAHGFFGQAVFALMICIAVMTTTTWRTAPAPRPCADGRTTRQLAALVVLALFGQLFLGALVRHLKHDYMIHMTAAGFILALILASGIRFITLHGDLPFCKRLAHLLMGLTGVQIVLGVISIYILGTHQGPNPPLSDVLFTTAHQMNGAAMLSLAVMLAMWSGRLLSKEAASPAGPHKTN